MDLIFKLGPSFSWFEFNVKSSAVVMRMVDVDGDSDNDFGGAGTSLTTNGLLEIFIFKLVAL